MLRSLFLTLAAIATCTSVLGNQTIAMEDDTPVPEIEGEEGYVPVDFEGPMKLLEALSSKSTISVTTPPICVSEFLLQRTNNLTSPPSYAFQVEGCVLKKPNGKGYCPSTSTCRSVYEVTIEPIGNANAYVVTSIGWLD